MISELERIDAEWPELGAQALANAMTLWDMTLDHLQKTNDANGKKLYHNKRQSITFPFVDALCWLLASRYFIMDLVALKVEGKESPVLQDSIDDYLDFYANMSKVQVTHAAGEVDKVCSSLVFGYATDETEGLDEIESAQRTLDRSLRGFGAAKEAAAEALIDVMIPEALDYPG